VLDAGRGAAKISRLGATGALRELGVSGDDERRAKLGGQIVGLPHAKPSPQVELVDLVELRERDDAHVEDELRCIVSCQRNLPSMVLDTLIRSPIAVHAYLKQITGPNEWRVTGGRRSPGAVRFPDLIFFRGPSARPGV